jgi:cyclopropane-fatty-acyl-phospholipid synthase
MQKNTAKAAITHLFRIAGIIIDGNHLWDIQVRNENFYLRLLRDGELGLGESYVDGWWDCPRVDMLVERLFEAEAEHYLKAKKPFFLKNFLAKFINYQTRQRAFEVSRVHYDLGNLLFESTLGPTLSYTNGYWANAQTLEEAQIAKLEMTCKDLMLEPGMHILDLGCGWGSFARYAAEHYSVSVVGFTTSKQQFHYAQKYCQNLNVEIRYADYRDVTETYDRIVSLGTFKHIGVLNYRNHMQIVHDHLTREGIFLLHTVGTNLSKSIDNLWITKYMYPDSVMPSISQIGKSIEDLLVMENWHNAGSDFDKTFMAWHKNFNANWDAIKVYYDDRFFRMWNYYLLSCAGGFRARVVQMWQIVFSRSGLKDNTQHLTG